MTRRSGTRRTTQPGSDPARPSSPTRYPSLRQRRPVVFWVVILAVAAMVLSTVATALSAIL